MRPGHFRWPTDANIPLFLFLYDEDGLGVSGVTPRVSIRRYKEVVSGDPLDNWFWDGAGFTPTATYHNMTEFDPVNDAGLYVYTFTQALIALEHQYLVMYAHDDFPQGRDHEVHIVTNEVYIPRSNPDPVVFGPTTVMGQLQLMKDGGTNLFDPDKDSLHFLNRDLSRVLGLLHQNAMLDMQQYDSNSQLISARLRVFDDATYIPSQPGGNEVLGLDQEYLIEAEYDSPGKVQLFTLKKVQ